MYLWKIRYIVRDATIDFIRTRWIITARSRLEDADYRARQISDDTDELVTSHELLGYLPSVGETTSSLRPKVYYAMVSYTLPAEPQASENTRRVLSECFSAIDPAIGAKIGITDRIGPIATGPEDALDVAKIGLVLGLANQDVGQAKEVIRTHVFKGEVEYEDINILKLQLASAYNLT